MDVLLDFLKAHPDASEEDIAAAVTSTVDVDVSAERYQLDPDGVRSAFSDPVKLGEISVIRKEHLFKLLFELVSNLSTSRLNEDVEAFVRQIPWIENVFGQVIALLCWNDIVAENVPTARKILPKFFQLVSSQDTPVLKAVGQVFDVLKAQFGVVDELLSRRSLLEPESIQFSDETEFGELFSKAFSDLDETSVLGAVLNFSDLESIDVETIRSLPQIPSTIEDEVAPSPSLKRVRFESEESKISDGNSEVLGSERKRDVSIFMGYSVLLNVMMLTYCDAASRKVASRQLSKRSSRSSLHRGFSQDDTQQDFDLVKSTETLRQILPLEFRVEILENVFSLLFVRSEDMKEEHARDDVFEYEGVTDTDSNSVKSWTSATRKIREGFCCCSEGLVRKVLEMLKEVVIVTSTAVRLREGKTEVEADVMSSVTTEDLPGRVSGLQQKVADALWRLDVVTYPKEVPLSFNSAYVEDLMKASFLTRQAENSTKKTTRKRRRKRHASSILRKYADTSIIEKMLSSPSSLLHICLHRGSFDLADQVVQIFAMDAEHWKREITFGESFADSVQRVSSSAQEVTPKIKRLGSFEMLTSLPLSPHSELTDEHLSILVAIDHAILRSDTDTFPESVKSITESMRKLETPFPAVNFNAQNIKSFGDFLSSSLEMSVTLNQKLPFLQATPFNPVAGQSFAAVLEEISRRVKRLQQLLMEPSKAGSKEGVSLVKQLVKVCRSSLPPTGLLGLVNGEPLDNQSSRRSCLLGLLTFVRNFAACLKMDPDGDNFGLLYQNPYLYLRKMFADKRPVQEIDLFIKNLSLNIPEMLVDLSGWRPPLSSSELPLSPLEQSVTLNIADHEKFFTTSTDPSTVVTSCLARLLKLFKNSKDNLYEPTTVPFRSAQPVLSDLSSLLHSEFTFPTEVHRICFFLNLYNLLFLHALLHVREYSSRFQLDLNEVSRRVHSWCYRYEVGSYGLIRLQDLFEDLSSFRNTAYVSRFGTARRKENGFLMADAEKRVTVKVYYPEIFQQQVDVAIAEYVNRTTWYEIEKKVVHVPPWLFRVYAADKLTGLLKKHWNRTEEVDFEEATLEPSGRKTDVVDLRRQNSLMDYREQHAAEKSKSAEADFPPQHTPHLSDLRSFRKPEDDIPLDELLPYIASPCSWLFDLLSLNGNSHSLLPPAGSLSNRSLLRLVFSSHDGALSTELLCDLITECVERGGDPVALLEAPIIAMLEAKNPQARLVHEVTLALCIEKKLVTNSWTTALRIRDVDLRNRAVSSVWKEWPLSVCVRYFDLTSAEDPRTSVHSTLSRAKSLETLVRTLHAEPSVWAEVFPQWSMDIALNQISIKDLESKVESQFKIFSAAMLRADQIAPLNAWLRLSEMTSLTKYQDDLQMTGLIYMLDSKPPNVLSAYQLLMPLLDTSSFAKISELLDSLSSPEGRLPVIKIALLSEKFTPQQVAALKEREVENLVLKELPENLQKSLSHLRGHTLLVLEQLLMWNKLTYFPAVLKVPNLFDVVSQRMFEDLLVTYARKAVEMSIHSDSASEYSAESASGTSNVSTGSGVKDKRKARSVSVHGDGPNLKEQFVMPVVAPSKKEWMVDINVTACAVCGDKFGIFNRKHHCRRCGRIVDNACSNQTIQIDAYGEEPQRACDDCFEQTIALGTTSHTPRQSGIVFSAPRNSLRTPHSLAKSFQRKSSLFPPRERVSSPVEQSSTQSLTTDEDSNIRYRNEFSYAEAPDASLCVGLLKLHSSPLLAGKELLKIGNDLSEWVGAHGDYGMEHTAVVGIMRTLFFSAKLFLHQDRDSADWVHVCDLYLNQLQLIELLLDAGATEIPSVQQMAEMDTVRRVRDQLVVQERYALAIELSTKAGVDSGHVWLSWGRSLLRAGRFLEAREKLSKCLKSPLDKAQFSTPSLFSVEELMDIIDGARMPRKRGTFSADSLINLVMHGDILKMDAVDPSVVEEENQKKMSECLYYQEMYGTHATLLRFFMKKNLTQKALEYSLRENVGVEVIMENIVVPSLRAGQLASLEDELLLSDPTLGKWADTLIGICEQLSKRNMTHVLLQFQIFIKDYARAATTCIILFQRGPSTRYQDYQDRIRFLEQAQKHLTTSLEKRNALQTEPLQRVRSNMSITETGKFLKTIELQISITQFLASETQTDFTRSTPLPTLFGNTQAKTDLLGILFEHHATPKIEEDVLAIIENHGMDIEDVLVKAASGGGKESIRGILNILSTLRKEKRMADSAYDALVLRMIGQCGPTVMASAAKEWEVAIRQMSSDEKKVEAFVKGKKLRSAYLLAVQMQRVDLVAFVGAEAQQTGDGAVQSLCTRWLETKTRKA